MMRGSTGFDAYEARRQLLEEWHNVAALELAANDYMTCRVNSVDLKNRLCNIETNCRDRLHVWLLRIVGASTAPTSMALPCRWRSRPQHQKRTHTPQQKASLLDRRWRGGTPAISFNGRLWNIGPIAGSFRLNAGGLDHFGPPLGIVGDELAEVGGRAGQHGTAQISEPRLDFGISQARIDLFVELVNNLGRRIFRGADAGPEDRLVAREELAYRRDVRQVAVVTANARSLPVLMY